MKVFIIHTRRTAYGVVRCLAQTSCTIFGADTVRNELAHSKYLKDFFLIPEITERSEKDFLEVLIALAHKMDFERDKPMVFTGKDDYLLFFARHHATLSRYFIFSFEPSYARLTRALDKLLLAETALALGVTAPRSHSLKEFEREEDAPPFPVIIKPAIKCRPEVDVVRKAFRLRVCEDLSRLKVAVRALEDLQQPYIIQEYIPGGDEALFTCGVYCFQGRLVAWSTSRKIRQFPPLTGECSFGETVHLPELVEPARRLVEAIGLSGIAQIEFKKHNGRFYLIEINPRIWSWHEIHRFVGVNFVLIAVKHLLGLEAFDRVVAPRPERRTWIFLSMDILHNVFLQKNASWFRVLCDFIGADAEAFWNPRDPIPAWEHWRKTIPYIASQISARRRRLTSKHPPARPGG